MKDDLRWPIGITMILVVFVVANLLVMRLASDDPAFAIEPDYYNKAVAYDSTLVVEQRSAALGWSASSAMARNATGVTLAVTLVDAVQHPVVGALVTVSARFNARANDVLTGTLREIAAGRYVAPLAVRHAGQWEVRIDARRGAEHFVASARVEAPAIR